MNTTNKYNLRATDSTLSIIEQSLDIKNSPEKFPIRIVIDGDTYANNKVIHLSIYNAMQTPVDIPMDLESMGLLHDEISRIYEELFVKASTKK